MSSLIGVLNGRKKSPLKELWAIPVPFYFFSVSCSFFYLFIAKSTAFSSKKVQ
jgi:hypothetical protein